MSEQDMRHLREKLLERRRDIFKWVQGFESDWRALSEREIEMEEEAQKSDLSSLYDQLDERSTEELAEIDLALCRFANGSYGICEHCRKPIPLKRLEALPASRLCRKCAHKYETAQRRLPRAGRLMASAELPLEYKNLSNKELRSAVLEHLRDDGRVEMEELEVSCRKGVVYLDGVVPSETEHQILLEVLTDAMGLPCLVDRLRINGLRWQREDRTAGVTPFPPSTDEDEMTEDVFESQEEGLPYECPDGPLPEET